MAVAWPVSIPFAALNEQFSEQFEVALATFSPAVGPPHSRRRSEIDSDALSFGLVLSGGELNDLLEFYETALIFGTQAFTATHPRTFEGATFTFMQAPDIVGVLHDCFRVAIRIRKMP